MLLLLLRIVALPLVTCNEEMKEEKRTRRKKRKTSFYGYKKESVQQYSYGCKNEKTK